MAWGAAAMSLKNLFAKAAGLFSGENAFHSLYAQQPEDVKRAFMQHLPRLCNNFHSLPPDKQRRFLEEFLQSE